MVLPAAPLQVSVKQNGYDVYQTTVPPGPFTIDDINSAANGGDLQVTIKEADGSIQTLYVPYSSVPVLQRAGYTRYALAMGNIVVEITCKAPQVHTR
ncbi:fimbria/pilus outer membrane usher protein [Escherichia coli]|nr:fimbria/pilus outer membrane usher protein [Escherichia coli]